MPYSLSQHSKDVLSTVNPKMQDVLNRVVTTFPLQLIVTQGLRTAQEEMELWLRSHYMDGTPNGQPKLTGANGYKRGVFCPNGCIGTGESSHQSGLAIDVVVQRDGIIVWAGEDPVYLQLADAMKQAAKELNLQIDWGGDWVAPNIKDWDHFSLVV